jgi:hypothetical protein
VGSRSKGRARAQANAAPDDGQHGRPLTVLLACVVQALESVGVLVAAVFAGIEALQGKAYQNSSGIALTIIGIGTAAALALVTVGLARVRRWSRTPALLTQLFTGIVGIYLVQGERYWLGVPALALAVAGMALLFLPPSLHALTFTASEPAAPAK